MDYYWEVCDNFIKPKSRYKHLKSKTHKEFDKGQHRKLTIKNPDINNVARAFCECLIQHNKKYDLTLLNVNLIYF